MAAVLIIGGGGREHALAWRMARSESVEKVWIAPGNGADFEKPDIDTTNADEVVAFCQRENISLIVVGPEGPLAEGLVDRIDGRVPVFGPTRAGAQLEASKVFSKMFMKKYRLPTAEFEYFSDIASAEIFIEKCDWDGIVVKADGLAGGKGVVVADDKESATAAARQFLAVRFFPHSSDSRTSGMGVIAPVSVPETVDYGIDRILEKTVASLRKEGIIYKGVIYAGLMVTTNGPQLLEYNCRFGDPETEIIMRLLRSDLYTICMASINGTLSEVDIQWDDRHACGIVLASKNYPYSGDKGTRIGKNPLKSLTYGDSGVDISEGNAFVSDIKDLVKSTLKQGTEQ
ncbi:phosphoribosylamine--glycine ligase, partial [Teladorsagia circumcincta]